MKITNKDQDIEDFSPPQREYTDTELRGFHDQIQRFWDAPREVVLARGMSGTAQSFRHQDLHVAYGAARKILHGKQFVYQYTSERYREFCNLWDQYESWRGKQDWIDMKQAEQLEGMAEQIPF